MAWTVWDGQQNVTTDNYQEMKAAVARREGGSPSSGGSTSSSPYSGGSRDGGVQIEGGNASNSYSMDGASYKKYEDDYHFWQETGTYRENAEVNQDEFSAWKAIHDATELGGKWGYAGGKYYTISDDAYNAYDDDYAYWQKNGKSKDEFQSNEADYNAWRTIRDTVNTTGSNIAYDENYSPWGYLDGDEATYRNEVLKRAAADWADDWKYDVYSSDPALSAEDARRQAAGEMPYYWAKSYDLTNPYEKYLYDHNLPLNQGTFRNKIASAEKKTDKEVAAYNEEVGRFNAYNEQKSDFLTKLYGHMNEVRTADRERAAAAGTNPAMLDTGGEYDLADGYTEDNPMRAEFERYAGELLTSGKYDLVAQNLSLSQDMDSKTGFDAAMAYGKESAADAKAQEKAEDSPYVFDMSQYWLTTDELYEGYLEAEAGMQAAYDAEANGTNVGSPIETYLSEVAAYDKETATAARDEIVAQIGSLDAQLDTAKQSGKTAEGRAAAGYVVGATAASTADSTANTQVQLERETLQFKLEVLENQIASADNKEKIAAAEATVAEKYSGILSAPDFKAVSETPIGRYDGATMDRETYRNARHLEVVSERVNDIVPTSDPYYASQFFTWDEFYTYRYIVNTQGAEAGLQYFHDMEPILNQRNYDNIEAISRRMATDNPVLHSICTVFQKLGSWVEGFNVTLDGAFYELSGGKTGRQLTYNDPRTSGTAIGNEVRGGIQSDITATSGELMGQLYGLGMSLADNAMRAFVAKGIGALTGVSAIGSNAMAASMYGQVAASTVNEYMQQGAGSKQALLMGVLSAGAEAIGEAISLGELLKIKGTPGGALTKSSMFWNYMKRNALTEGGSEAITSVASYLFDWMVMQDESKLRTVYDDARLKGKTRGGAFFAAAGELFKEAAIEGVAGAISGSLLGGVNYVGSMYETGKSAGARAGSRISTGASAQADLFNAFAGLDNAVNLTQEQYAAQNGITNQKQAARAYDKAVAKGMAIDPEMRLQIVADLNAIGMTESAVEDMLTKLDPFLVSPASLASPELTTSLMKFSSVLKRAADVSAQQEAANQTRTVKAKQRLTALYDAVTKYQMAAAQAKANGDVAGHAQAINGLSEGITKYKNALAVYQSEAAEQKVQAEIEVRDAAKAVTDMADSIAATADTERAYQAERLTATMAEMAGDDTTNALLHMMGELQAQESAAQPLNTEALHAEEAAAMESGDEGRYNAIQRIREAYGKGDATAYKDALDAYEAITGVNVGAAAADDTIDHIVNGGQNGAETQRADVSVPDAERGRNNDGARQRDVRREDRGGNAQPASEVAGVRSADAGNQKTVRNRATHEQWVEADKAGFRQKLSADINEQLGHGESLVAADDIETVDDVTPESKGYFAKAMNILGGNSPKLYRYKEGANRPVHGCAIAGREYVEYTGRTTDVFHLGHERAENTKAYRDAGFAALKAMGHYGDVVFDYYLASRGIRGIRGEQRAEMQKEFVCDMFGAYIADVALGLNLYGDLGVDDTTAREFADAFAKSMAAAAEVDSDGETEFSTNSIAQQLRDNTDAILNEPLSAQIVARSRNGIPVAKQKEIAKSELGMYGSTIDRKGFGAVELGNNEIDSSFEYINSDAEYSALFAVPHVIKRGIELPSGHADHKGRGFSTVTFAAHVEIGNQEGMMAVIVKKIGKNRYKALRVLTPEGKVLVLNKAIAEPTNGGGSSKDLISPSPINSATDITIPKSAQDSKGNTEVNTKNLQFTPVAQAISSAKTSIKQVPALFTDKNAHFGKTNIDIGGGKYDLATDYLAGQGTQNMVFDPYNRMASENTETLGFLQAGSKADTATCANVLNVIAEPNARANVILEAAKAIGQDGRAYFMVYEGDGSGIGRTTSAGWQNNRKTADYVDEIGQYFGTVTRKGKLITAENPRSNLPKASWEITPGQAVEFSTNTVADPLRDADAAEAFNLYERGVSYGEYQNYPDAKPSVTKHLRGMWDKSRQIEAVREAERLYADGEDPISYYERAYKDKTYNPMVASQLRGMLIRNGQQVGGALSEGELRQLTENKENWKQLKNVRLSVTSPGRNFENLGMWRDNDIPSARAKNYEEGKRLRDNYFTFGQYQMAEKNKWMAEEGEKVRQAFGSGGTLESSIAQMLGEGMITDDDVQGARRGKDVTIVPRADGGVFVLDKHFNLTAASDGYTTVMLDAQYRSRKEAKAKAIAAIKKNASISDDKKASLVAAAQREYKAVKPQVQEYALQVSEKNGVLRVTAPTGTVIAEVANGRQVDAACVTRTRDALIDFYDRALDQQNRALIENGYAPINKRNNYFPHQGRADIGVEGLISQLRDETLPTAISGETSTFKPGKPFTTHLLERMGDYTEFDATRGFDKYLAAAGDLIYSTPVIQRLRQLERTVRESEGTTNTALVSWLKEYGNLWANKKSFLDRAIEESTGRSVYTLSNKLTGLVSASAIGFNPRSALSNAIGLLNSFPTLDAKRIPAAMARTIANGLSGNKDGFGTDIPFLVNRRSGYGGIQTRLSDKLKVKGSKAMYAMFEVMDYLTTETSARAKYDELRAKGYAEAEAGAKTSDYLMDVYADRTKGAAPTIFSKKSLKPIMQYQLEVMNQLFHFRDIDRQGVAEQVDRIMRDNGGTLDGIDFAAAENRIHGAGLPEIGRKLAYLLLLSAWGAVTRGLFGSDQSWNPVGMVTDAIGDYKAGGIKRAATGLASTASDQLPFISTLAGGRIPVAAGASNFVDAIEAIAGGNTDKALTAAGKGVLSFVPGGGQINRTIQGAQAAERGGNYTDRGRLRYPIETGADKAKSIIFGASAAAPQGYRWGEDVLSDSETEAYDEAKARGVDDFDMYDFLLTGYDSSGKTTKLLSLAAANPPKDEVDIIAEVLGIDYKGNLDRAAKSAARDREKELKMQLKRGKIDQAAYDSKMATIDMYLAMLG